MKLFTIALVCASASLAQQTNVQLDNSASKVSFTLDSVLHTVHGTFKLKRTDLWFDASTGKAGGQLVVDATSGESGSGARDKKMHKEILESAKYPEIVFTPDRVDGKVNPQGDSDVKLHGTMLIHGGTHEVVLNAKTHVDQQELTATVDFAVPYINWGMKNPSTLFLRVNGTVDIHIEASGQLVRN